MQKDAEAHAEDDRKRREVVDLKNQGDQMAYQVEKMLREQGEKVSASDRSNMESAVSALREALKGDDAQAIKRSISNLEQASHKLAEQMYHQAGPAPGQAGPQTPPPGQQAPPKGGKDGEDVIDAEYEAKE